MEYGIHCLPCSYIKDIIDMLPKELEVHIDVIVALLGRHSAEALSTTVGYSMIAIVTDIWRHLTYNSRET